MIYAFVVAALAVAALAFVAAPIRRRDQAVVVDRSIELEEKKLVALTAILDLENERDVGKLSEEDFTELRAVYETQALEALHQLDEVATDRADPLETDPLETEIARVRERMSASRCPACGAPRRPGTDACARCGA
jgi:hypothetical protein